MTVTLIDKMGSDLSVVNAARVSFGKAVKKMSNGDERLIKYLAKHHHWTPFAHTCLTFHVKAPIFVARQLGKHQVGLAWNEISRRYVTYDPDFWEAEVWRKAAEDKKQGSTKESVTSPSLVKHVYEDSVRHAECAYAKLLDLGVCPEQARAVLPQSTFTEWYWTGSLHAFSRVCKLRIAKDAQAETEEIARKISSMCNASFPVSWDALTEYA